MFDNDNHNMQTAVMVHFTIILFQATRLLSNRVIRSAVVSTRKYSTDGKNTFDSYLCWTDLCECDCEHRLTFDFELSLECNGVVWVVVHRLLYMTVTVLNQWLKSWISGYQSLILYISIDNCNYSNHRPFYTRKFNLTHDLCRQVIR